MYLSREVINQFKGKRINSYISLGRVGYQNKGHPQSMHSIPDAADSCGAQETLGSNYLEILFKC